ncbi:sugar ABC transporter permease, partial [Priestia filamentosa]
MAMASNKKNKTIKVLTFYVGLISLLIVSLFPFFIMLMTSFKSSKEAVATNPTLLPKDWTLQHY